MKTKAALGALVAVVVIGALLLLSSNTGPAGDVPSATKTIRRTASPQTAQPKNPSVEATQMLQPLPTSGATSPASSPTQGASPTATTPLQLLSTLELSTPEPGRVATSLSPVSPASPAPQPTEGFVGEPPTPSGRLAPDAAAGPLKFQQIRISQNDSTGTFSGRANMTNTGPQFLNGLVVSWRILDGAGHILDHGQFNWPNLAPGETATVSFDGSATFVDSWASLDFELMP